MTFDNLIALHEMLWPETNLKQQESKWHEEDDEWYSTVDGSEEELHELADMIIVSAGIARFDYVKGLEYFRRTLGRYDTFTDLSELWRAVETKMRKNMKRDWVKKADVGYHHISTEA